VQALLGSVARFGGVQVEDLVLVAGWGEDLVVRGEVADDWVVVEPGAVADAR
jgi:hypothetical protein